MFELFFIIIIIILKPRGKSSGELLRPLWNS